LFAQTLREIAEVASQAESSAADLARVVTLDIAMSVRLLKIANSPMLNPQGRDIDSVSAAVVLMGFDAVRDLAFSLSLVGELSRADADPRLVPLLAHAFHTAAQAQTLARALQLTRPEEAFVAGLLLHVGELAFWSRPRPETETLRDLLDAGTPAEQAERAALGFTLSQLSRCLAEEWHLSGLLRTALAQSGDVARARPVLLADELAHVVERHGWGSAEAREPVRRVAGLLNLPEPDVQRLLQDASRAAGRMAGRFGVASVERLLNTTPGRPGIASAADPAAPTVPTAVAITAAGHDAPGPSTGPDGAPRPDPRVELAAVRELQVLSRGTPDLADLVRLVLRGVRDGIGMDLVLFAILSRDRQWLSARHRAGGAGRDGVESWRVPVGDGADNLFRVLLRSGKAIWVDDATRQRLGRLVEGAADVLARGQPFFAMPVLVRGRPVGLLYADRGTAGSSLSAEAFASFRHFGEQIGDGLSRS
jgi:HD-like signal output (HDOD) protein